MTALAIGARLTAAMLGLAHVALLAQRLDAAALGTVLFALGLATLGGGLLAAGQVQHLLRAGPGAPIPHTALRALAFGAAAGAVTITTAGAAGLLPLSPGVAGVTAAMAVIQGASALAGAAQRANGRTGRAALALGPLRVGLPLCLTAATPAASVEACLALAAAGQALALLPLLPGLPRVARAPAAPRALGHAQAGWLMLSHLDLLAAGILLPGDVAGVYLLARRCAAPLALVVEGVRFCAASALAQAYATGDGPTQARRWHRHTAAAGGLALAATIGALVLLPPAIGTTPIVLPLVLAHIAAQTPPILFGLGGVALNMAGHERARRRLLWRVMALAAPLLAGAALMGALQLALAHAAVHLAQGAAAARLLRGAGDKGTAATSPAPAGPRAASPQGSAGRSPDPRAGHNPRPAAPAPRS